MLMNAIEIATHLVHTYKGTTPARFKDDNSSVYLDRLSNARLAAYVRSGSSSYFLTEGAGINTEGMVTRNTYLLDIKSAIESHPIHLARFIYRILELAGKMLDTELRLTFLSEIENIIAKESIQIKYIIPSFVSNGSSEFVRVNELFSKFSERNRKLFNLATLTTDEVELTLDFLGASFRLPKVGRPISSVYGIGSCFAINMVRAIKQRSPISIKSDAFPVADDMNTPLANIRALKLALSDDAEVCSYLDQAESTFCRHPLDRKGIHSLLSNLRQGLISSDLILFTLDGVVDFFNGLSSFDRLLTNFGVTTASLKEYGYRPRLATTSEVMDQISGIVDLFISRTNATLVLTVSPVPMINAVGVSTSEGGIFSLDTIAKSRLRSCLHEVLTNRDDFGTRTFYFPSYEIVRTLSLYQPRQAFGCHDLHIDHLDPEMINSIASVFLSTIQFQLNRDSPSSLELD